MFYKDYVFCDFLYWVYYEKRVYSKRKEFAPEVYVYLFPWVLSLTEKFQNKKKARGLLKPRGCDKVHFGCHDFYVYYKWAKLAFT